jgi:lysophospholipid hydrolase
VLAQAGPLRAPSHNAVPNLATTFTAMASELSNGAQVASSVSSTLAAAWDSSTMQPLADALNTASADIAASPESTSWLGLFGWLLYIFFNLTSTVLYWVVRIATISIPRLLYTLFSTSWTVTMNATTLYACPCLAKLSTSWLTRWLACSSWLALCLPPVGS